ncbi:hypothetical protein WT83_11145 [Burkholderia territorii]|uniref:Uncharacterized protein n=1 Tax=Burkholderia territorii TaxID=1503055 RepID=A0A125K7U1_9BURK|nr:hypothetical protein WT83_11145 [Burkholderia territorii]
MSRRGVPAPLQQQAIEVLSPRGARAPARLRYPARLWELAPDSATKLKKMKVPTSPAGSRARPVVPRSSASGQVGLLCAALRCSALLCAALRCSALLCAALRCAGQCARRTGASLRDPD